MAHYSVTPVARPQPWTQPIEFPECPPGWRTGPPDFVGVGVQRAGTSWWYRGAIRPHARVAKGNGTGKELHFFDRFWPGAQPEYSLEDYHRLFPRPEGTIAGEWTPRYLADFWSLGLLRQAAPDARILVLLRDPVARFLSGVAHARQRWEGSGEALELAELNEALWRGFYYEQLRHLFEIYPREQVLVLQFERCVAEPQRELRRTTDFLGLEPYDEPPERLGKHSTPKAAGRKPELTPELREQLIARYRDDVARLADLCPEIDVALWPNFAG
jgi:hypothetical protein